MRVREKVRHLLRLKLPVVKAQVVDQPRGGAILFL